jgi:N-acetylglucosaminyl-diphospho-decaprenol L-rhamnosyltransferase
MPFQRVSPLEMNSSFDVIIVNWNAGPALRDCIASIPRAAIRSIDLKRVVLVDNASSDGSLSDIAFPGHSVTLLQNSENRGFGAACNQGALGSEADYLLFLNPDTRLGSDSITVPLTFLEQPENRSIGICGIRLTGEGGAAAICAARFPSVGSLVTETFGLNRLLPRIFPSRLLWSDDLRGDGPVDQVIGAFFLVRRRLFEALGGFDERFFLYFEEVDFSLRARAAGHRSYYLDSAHAVHLGGVSSSHVKSRRLFYSLQSRLRFAAKHFSAGARIVLLLFTIFVEPLARIAWSCRLGSLDAAKATLKGYASLYGYLLNAHVFRFGANRNYR